MRRKSGRNAAKASPEKVVETPRRSRRHSKRRKRSSSRSSSEGSDDVSLKTVAQQMSETAAVVEVPKPEGEGIEHPVWTVTPTTAPGGEIQKLKICLTRPSPSSPDKNETTSRRRRNRSSGIQEDEQQSPDEIVTRKSRHRGSPGTSFDEQEQNELDDKKGTKGKSKTKHKSKTEKTTKIQEDEDKTESELIENVQVTPQSPHATIDSVDSESVSAVEPQSVDEIESNSILQNADVEEIQTPDENNQNFDKVDDKIPDDSSNNQTTSNFEGYFKGFEIKNKSDAKDKVEFESHNKESNEEDKITNKEKALTLNQETSENKVEEVEVVPAITISNEPETRTTEIVAQTTGIQIVNATKTTSETVAEPVDLETIETKTTFDAVAQPVEVEIVDEIKTSSATVTQAVDIELVETKTTSEAVTEPVDVEIVETKTTSETVTQAVGVEVVETKITSETVIEPVDVEIVETKTTSEIIAEPVDETKTMSETVTQAVDIEIIETKTTSETEPVDNKIDDRTTNLQTTEKVEHPSEVVVVQNTDVPQVVGNKAVANEQPEKNEEDIPLPNDAQGKEELVIEEVTKDLQVQEQTASEPMSVQKEHTLKSVQVQEEQTSSEPVQKDVRQISQRRSSKTESSSSEDQETVEKIEVDENTESQSSLSDKHKRTEKPEETQPDEDSQSVDAIIIDSKEESSFNLTQSFSPAVRELDETNQEIQNLKHEISDLFPPTPKKRKWGGSSSINQIKSSLRRINIEYIKELYPDVKLLDESELKMNIVEPKDRRKSTDVKEKRPERKVSIEHFSEHMHFETQASVSSIIEENAEAEVDNANIIAMNRKISIVDDTASKLKPPPSPAKHPIGEVLFITNLVRPFTLKQLKELLERTGKIRENGFWTDRIKSKCYVYYETTEEAESTRNALHGVHWPIGNGKKLIIDYATPEDLETARNPPAALPAPAPPVPEQKVVEKENEIPFKKMKPEEPEKIVKEKRSNEMHVREWDVGKEEMHRRVRSKSRERNDHERNDKRRHKRTPSPEDDFISRKQKKKEEEIPQKLMDDLFQKTKTTPSIYWLPLTPDEIATKQQQRLLRMAEHKRRMEESSRGRGDYGRGAPYRRRYD